MRKSAALQLRSAASPLAGGQAGILSKAKERLLGAALLVCYHIRLGWYRIARPITLNARVLVVEGDQVLLVRVHGGPYWLLPGGGVKRNESLAEAAQREVHEETGCQIAIEGLLGMYTHYAEYKSEHIAIFVARPLSGPSPRSNCEIAEARFFPISELPAKLFPEVRARLDEYLSQRWGVVGAWAE
jgi:8-oxo-dGTP pyrophosphatase MutT (NUDIX family)